MYKSFGMRKLRLSATTFISLTFICIFYGCAPLIPVDQKIGRTTYLHNVSGNSLIERYAPIFIVEDSDKNLNRIGFPSLREKSSGEFEAYIDTERPASAWR